MSLSEDPEMIPKLSNSEVEKDNQSQQFVDPQILQIAEQSNFESVEKEEFEDEFEPSLDDDVIQERIQKLVKAENLADITLPGYVIKLIRLKGPLTFDQIIQDIVKCFGAFRRADGSRYTGDIFKALKGCLSSAVFKEEIGAGWIINEKEAVIYENRTTQKIKSILSKQESKLLTQNEKNGNQVLNKKRQKSEENENSPNKPKNEANIQKKQKFSSKRKKKRRPEEYQKVFDILKTTCKAYRMDEKTKYLIKNPFEKISSEDSKTQLVQKLGKDRLTGILQCFDYFFPLLEDYLMLKTNGSNNNPVEEDQLNKNLASNSKNNHQKIEQLVEANTPKS